MNTGSTAGFPGVNTDINEWCTEATDSFSPPIVEKNLLVRNLLLLILLLLFINYFNYLFIF